MKVTVNQVDDDHGIMPYEDDEITITDKERDSDVEIITVVEEEEDNVTVNMQRHAHIPKRSSGSQVMTQFRWNDVIKRLWRKFRTT